MPKITFEMDPQTGEMVTHIQGHLGPGCEEVADMVKRAMGAPTTEEHTAEYHVRTQVRQGVRR